jgi:hypothetical protein
MAARWYYRVDEQVVGPVRASELAWLARQGTVKPSTPVRQGKDGAWIAAERIRELFEAGPNLPATGVAAAAEWFFTQGGKKLGPVPLVVLKKLSESGRLAPEELVWTSGMENWKPASQIVELDLGKAPPSSDLSPNANLSRSYGRPRSWPWMAGIAFAVLVACGTIATWMAGRAKPSRPARPLLPPQTVYFGQAAPGVNPGKGVSPGSDIARRPSPPASLPSAAPPGAEGLLRDALSAVRTGQVRQAIELIDRYLASPGAADREKAATLRRELSLATSSGDASQLARGLEDQELRDHLRDSAQSLAARLETPELRPLYRDLLLRALRQESARRQMVPREAIARLPGARFGMDRRDERQRIPERNAEQPPGPPARRSLLDAERGPDSRQADLGPRNGPPLRDRASRPASAADLNQIIASPAKYRGQGFTLDGLFKIGTRIAEVAEAKGQVVGLSIPVAWNDDRKICSGDRKVEGHELYLILDDQVAGVLDRVFKRLDLKPTSRPSFRAILGATVRQRPVGASEVDVLVVDSMEILGMCDYVQVAQHNYNEAFRVVRVDAGGGHTTFGDGPTWVERLGGEEKFVQPIRRKFREIQRRAATESREAMLDGDYQRELTSAMRAANAYNAIRAMEAATWRRIMP